MKRVIKLFLSLFLSFTVIAVCMLVCSTQVGARVCEDTYDVTRRTVSTQNYFYAVPGVYDRYTIDMSTNNLINAYNATDLKTENLTYTGRISSSYQVNIYKFKASKKGYYSFYTTGILNTVIKVYQKNNSKNSFTDLGKSRMGCLVDGNSLNANLVIECKKGYEYMVCVRAYGTTTGYYTLHCGGNEDLMIKSEYGYRKWTSYYPNKRLGYSQELERRYYTIEEVAILYCLLDPMTREGTEEALNIKIDDICELYKSNPFEGLDKFYDVAIVALEFVNMIDANHPIAEFCLSSVLSTLCSHESAFFSELKNVVRTRPVDGSPTVHEFYAEHGLLIIKKYCRDNIGTSYLYEYCPNDDEIYRCEKYNSGYWS